MINKKFFDTDRDVTISFQINQKYLRILSQIKHQEKDWWQLISHPEVAFSRLSTPRLLMMSGVLL